MKTYLFDDLSPKIQRHVIRAWPDRPERVKWSLAKIKEIRQSIAECDVRFDKTGRVV